MARAGGGVSGKPPWIWARIVKAVAGPAEAIGNDTAPLLSQSAKLLYCEIVGLCTTRAGCTLGAGAMGRRLGVSGRSVERIRADLVTLGLLQRKGRGEGRSASWFPTMPTTCRPKARRLDEDGLEVFANRLALLIIGKRAQTPDTSDGGVVEPPLLRAV